MNKASDRFWSKVEKTDTCWLWTSQLRNGYGLFSFEGKPIGAHIFSYKIHYGDTDNRFVCHSCDTPACVNPEHLFLGTHKDNMTDMRNKNRGNQSFSNEQVLEMRSRPKTPTMVKDLAKEFNTTNSAMKKMLDGTTYSWVPYAIEVPPQFSSYKLSEQDFREILAALEKPYYGLVNELSKKYGVTRDTIYKIRTGYMKYTDMK